MTHSGAKIISEFKFQKIFCKLYIRHDDMTRYILYIIFLWDQKHVDLNNILIWYFWYAFYNPWWYPGWWCGCTPGCKPGGGNPMCCIWGWPDNCKLARTPRRPGSIPRLSQFIHASLAVKSLVFHSWLWAVRISPLKQRSKKKGNWNLFLNPWCWKYYDEANLLFVEIQHIL